MPAAIRIQGSQRQPQPPTHRSIKTEAQLANKGPVRRVPLKAEKSVLSAAGGNKSGLTLTKVERKTGSRNTKKTGFAIKLLESKFPGVNDITHRLPRLWRNKLERLSLQAVACTIKRFKIINLRS